MSRPTEILRWRVGDTHVKRHISDDPVACASMHETREFTRSVFFGWEFHLTRPFSDGVVVVVRQAEKLRDEEMAALLLMLQGAYDLGVWPDH